MFLFVFWTINFGVSQIFHIISKVFPNFKKVKNHCRRDINFEVYNFFHFNAGTTNDLKKYKVYSKEMKTKGTRKRFCNAMKNTSFCLYIIKNYKFI